MSGNDDDTSKPAGSGRGHFFAVDADVWARVCSHRSMNLEAAYLVLARGSHFGTRRTSWSVNAIEAATSIARPRARLAIEGLEAMGAIEVLRGGTRPLYRLRAAHEMISRPAAPVLSVKEQAILDRVRTAAEPVAVPSRGSTAAGWPQGNLRAAVERMVSVQALRQDAAGRVTIGDAATDPEAPQPNWVWLPNSIVDGLGATPPLEQIRQTGDPVALRMFVDLYNAHFLAANGGIHWRHLRARYKRVKLKDHGPFVVWGFAAAGLEAWPTAPFFAPYLGRDLDGNPKSYGPKAADDPGWNVAYRALGSLAELGLIEFIVHIIDADTIEGEVLHPCPRPGTGEEREEEVMLAATEAAEHLLGPEAVQRLDPEILLLVPVLRHLTQIQAVGLMRLRHRPRTSATAAWLSQAKSWDEWVRKYDQISRKGEQLQSDATSREYQRGIKVTSR